MKLTAEQQALVGEELSRYLESTDSRKMVADLVDAAREASALPVYADMGGALLITTEGDVLIVSTNQVWDRNAKWETEADPQWRLLARIAASERYPQLSFLRPTRPVSAVDCEACNGTGSVEFSGCAARCGGCWSTGWIEVPEANPPPTGSAGG
ncbi:hypothetical protein [Polyangium jinanense]|uniref:Uncharacterized protein n=1 Tax=Polyangium jinanense TaxID=2829994 RepID=A0A9X3WX59_9BACT|nr:hypothetical protein [Polyangium jinanense]MDC3979814.1 hypothetical protein [Polyangium jinanense]